MVLACLACGLPPRLLPSHGCEGARRAMYRVCSAYSRFLNFFLGAPAADVVYPRQFKVFTVVALGNITLWFVTYMLISRPALQENYKMLVRKSGSHSEFSKLRIDYADCHVVYMGWFLFVRAIHFVPAISRRAAHLNSCPTHVRILFSKFCLGDGIMYMFIIASMLLCLSAMHSDNVGPVRILNVIAILGIHSVLVGLLGLFHVAWHHCLLLETLKPTPPDTVNHLETRAYDEHVFGDEDGKLFPGECAICLRSWEPSDRMKITPCQHAFHQECVRTWLKAANTCALCRKDLVETVKRSRAVGCSSPRVDPLPEP